MMISVQRRSASGDLVLGLSARLLYGVVCSSFPHSCLVSGGPSRQLPRLAGMSLPSSSSITPVAEDGFQRSFTEDEAE
jgi:hypothetical protein